MLLVSGLHYRCRTHFFDRYSSSVIKVISNSDTYMFTGVVFRRIVQDDFCHEQSSCAVFNAVIIRVCNSRRGRAAGAATSVEYERSVASLRIITCISQRQRH